MRAVLEEGAIRGSAGGRGGGIHWGQGLRAGQGEGGLQGKKRATGHEGLETHSQLLRPTAGKLTRAAFPSVGKAGIWTVCWTREEVLCRGSSTSVCDLRV